MSTKKDDRKMLENIKSTFFKNWHTKKGRTVGNMNRIFVSVGTRRVSAPYFF